ncbi:MAG: MotA/TolQ/ExbB proton channel family protein [Bacteroidetes bacterium]|nr:MAG: MotA/TolQ/ExbB proton channel family protein [Bacteroidota bacterium]
MIQIEPILNELARWFLLPVLAIICLVFVYALYAAGGFITELVLRRRPGHRGPLHALLARDPSLQPRDIEIHISRELEGLRLATRTAPMLGLVATMIPLGPALAGAATGQVASVSSQVSTAFAAVIIALVAASTCYTILIVRRRWRIAELRRLERETFTRQEA